MSGEIGDQILLICVPCSRRDGSLGIEFCFLKMIKRGFGG